MSLQECHPSTFSDHDSYKGSEFRGAKSNVKAESRFEKNHTRWMPQHWLQGTPQCDISLATVQKTRIPVDSTNLLGPG